MTIEQAEGRIGDLERALEWIIDEYESVYEDVEEDDIIDSRLNEAINNAEDVLYRGEAYAEEG